MMHALRAEAEAFLTECEWKRKPVLRRSLKKDWLYTTDLGFLIPEDRLAVYIRKMKEAGWETQGTDGWIEMRKTIVEPPVGWHPPDYGPEAKCCLSLLDRHECEGYDRETVFMLIKSGEQGRDVYEKACRAIHIMWSVRLRKKKTLPVISRSFFTEEHNDDYRTYRTL